MSPTLRWGLAAGCLIVLVDTISLLVVRSVGGEGEAAGFIVNVDLVANVIFFSLAGLRVGRATGMVRSAAEAGVIAGLIAGLAALIISQLSPAADAGPTSWQSIVEPMALNVSLGGLLGMLNGWIASRAATGTGKR